MAEQGSKLAPFGVALQRILRGHGVTQAQLARETQFPEPTLSRMCRGQRLTGPGARGRIITIIRGLIQLRALAWLDEANNLLAVAAMSELSPTVEVEAAVLSELRARPQQIHIETLPPLPPLVVGRSEPLQKMRARLLGPRGTTDVVHIQVIASVHGWAGVGKTTFAAVLAHDPDVRRVFSDGVLWTSLGPTPDVIAHLGAWGRSLGDATIGRARCARDASRRVAALLADKRIMLIVDDVWRADDASAFKIGGRGCAVLFTTRDFKLARDLAATADDVYRLPVLTDQEGSELLRQLAPSVLAQHPRECGELVRALEGLPLAIQVAGRLLNERSSHMWGVAELLYELREGRKLLESEPPPELRLLVSETAPSVAALLDRSTDHLPAATRACYAQLGVFAETPASFDLTALQRIWGTDPKPIVQELVNRGLLEPWHVPPRPPRYRIHAILRLHAASLLEREAFGHPE